MGYVGSPYNFVPFPSKVREYPENALPGHKQTVLESEGGQQELVSGVIRYEITAKTPIFVGAGREEGDSGPERFFRNAEGRRAIPGSSIRGLIRANVQVLSHSSFSDDIDDYALMYRNVAKNAAKGSRYDEILGQKTIQVETSNGKKSRSILEKVRAGYVRNEGGKYMIYDTAGGLADSFSGDMNYYILSERTVVDSYFDEKEGKGVFSFPFFLKNGKSIMQHTFEKRFEKIVSGKRTQYKGAENKDYKPYFESCSYVLRGSSVIAVGRPGVYERNGFAVSSGKMNMKKAIYIVPEIFEGGGREYRGMKYPFEIPGEDVRAFKIDLAKRETVLKGFGGAGCFDLPADGETRPVFYIYTGGRLYFGFTPRLRIFYDHTIKDGMSGEQKWNGLDYAKAMFGFSGKAGSYKSRLSFADAVEAGEWKEVPGLLILGEPKPGSSLDYLTADIGFEGGQGKGHTYNDEDFSLRGMKQYWLRDRLEKGNVPRDKEGKAFVQAFSALDSGAVFKGKLRFHNLKREELGLLLWSLCPGEGAEMNIGKGKAFGYGVISLRIESAEIFDRERMCDLRSLCLNPMKALSPDEMDALVGEYRSGMAAYLGGKDVDLDASIHTLLLMKNVPGIEGHRTKPAPEKIRQMTIGDKGRNIPNEYQNRSIPLQTPYEVMELPYRTEAEMKIWLKEKAAEQRKKTAQRSRESLRPGDEYEAVVKKTEGKKIKFRIEELALNSQLEAEDISYAKISRKMVKEEFSEGTIIKVRLEDIVSEGDKAIYHWNCTAKK